MNYFFSCWKRRSRETLGSDLCLTPDNFLFLTL